MEGGGIVADEGSVVGQLALELGIDGSSLRSQILNLSNNASNQLTSSFTGIGKKIGVALGAAFSVKAITSFTKECLSLGSDLAEVQNVVDTSFSSMSEYVNSFAKDAMKNFGLSETVAKKYMGTIGAMNNSFGFTEQASYDMAEAVTGLAGDVASFYNMSSDEAFTKLKSIWTGETESLKELGVVMTQTALDEYALNNGFGKTTAKMTEQEKVMLRFQYVTSALSDASGDFIKTQDSWANQTRILSLQFESLKATLGQGFINLFTPILKGLNNLLAKLSVVAEKFKSFTEAITGQSSATNNLENIASGALDAAGSVDSITESAQEAKKELAGFDKITKLSNDSSASSSGSGTITGSSSAGTEVNVPATSNTSGIESALDGIKERLTQFKEWSVTNFGPTLATIWGDFKKNTQELVKNLKKVFKDIQSLGKPLVSYFKGPFTKYLTTSIGTIGEVVNGLYDTFNKVFRDIWDKAVFPILNKFVTVALPTFTDFATKVTELGGTIFATLKQCFDKVWSEGVAPALEKISGMWCDLIDIMSEFWNEWGQPIFDGLKDAVASTGDVFKSIWDNMLKPVWDKFMEVVDEVWTEHLKPLAANFLDFVGEFVTGATEIYNKFIVPVVKYLSEILAPIFTNVFNIVYSIVKTVIGSVTDILDGVITTLKGIVEFLTGIFTGDVDKALNGVKGIFEGVFNSLEGIVRTPINLVIDLLNGMINGVVSGINTVIRAINKLKIDIPNWVPKYGGETLGFDIGEVEAPQIAHLAQGGYAKVNTPQLAVIGDNRHEGEIVSPESKLKEMAMEAIEASRGNDYSVEILRTLRLILETLKALDLDIVIDGKKLKDIIVNEINKNTKKNGVCEILF